MLSIALEVLRRIFALPGRQGPAATPAPELPGADLIFRLRAWPQLPEHGRTAEVYRMLSIMSNQPVSRRWLFSRCSMPPEQLDALLQQLVAEGSVEVIDPIRFARSEPQPEPEPCRA